MHKSELNTLLGRTIFGTLIPKSIYTEMKESDAVDFFYYTCTNPIFLAEFYQLDRICELKLKISQRVVGFESVLQLCAVNYIATCWTYISN